ncbi:MAG: hypothetical protein JWR62_198, partial [Modestobacter sp.]|nr:hypothetical protein [Modestobacter sp.]
MEPIRLILMSRVSPAVIGPTPGGAPVNTTSPGFNV